MRQALKRMMNRDKHQQGFTLIELLIVIGILAVVAAVAIPNLTRFMGSGKEESYDSDKNVIQTAIGSFYTDYGIYPTTDGDADADPSDGDDSVIFGPNTGADTTLSAAVDVSADNDRILVASLTNIAVDDYLMIGGAGDREVVQVTGLDPDSNPATDDVEVSVMSTDHASGGAVTEVGLVTLGFLTEVPGSASVDNPGATGSEGHYTWFITTTGSVASGYNSTAAASGTDYADNDWEDGVYP
ncbi:MAG: type II secretion system protein [Chloroflexota bacterium]|nr:type II secretion system protein [Chloroflexota bacterium]